MEDEILGELEPLTDSKRRSDECAPVPTWEQVTRSVDSPNPAMVEHAARIIAGNDDAEAALRIWETWSSECRRSVALLIHKICHEGWLDSVGPIAGWPWDGGFFFGPHAAGSNKLIDVLDSKSRGGGVYTRGSLRCGLAAFLTRWNHRAWVRSWIENDSPFASLHVGIFKNGCAEVHLDLFNPLFINGAPQSDITKLPLVGPYNHRLFRLHRKWEGAKHGSATRTSANLYHLMRGLVPLCF